MKALDFYVHIPRPSPGYKFDAREQSSYSILSVLAV